MNKATKQKLPLLFLIGISVWWAYYYQSNSQLNEFGHANFEWLYLLDGLLVLPLLCFFCIKDKKEAAMKAVIYCLLVVFIGSYIIPEQNKIVLNYLETGRYFILALFLIFESIALYTVYLAIRNSLNLSIDPDEAISTPIYRYLGNTNPLAKLLTFETRMWTYAFFANKIKPCRFKGEHKFNYHLKDGAQSNSIGFIIIITFEAPIMHLILHFLWSPLAANIITLLTIFSLLFFISEYRAMPRRPISIDKENLNIRFGIYNNYVIPLNNISFIQRNSSVIKRSKNLKRFNFAGNPNMQIKLKTPDNKTEYVYLGIDNPNEFYKVVSICLGSN